MEGTVERREEVRSVFSWRSGYFSDLMDDTLSLPGSDSAEGSAHPDGRDDVLQRRGWYRAAVLALLVLATWLRFYQLDQYPLGVHHDELSNIYDGYSLAETGADRFGASWPASVRAFGENDYRPAMYAWLAAVPVKLLGFSVKAGRIPAAILGTGSLVLLYLFARSLGGPVFALLALLLGTLSPLHIQYSRVAHEGAMLPAFFTILILYLWQRSALRLFPIARTAVLGVVVGLSANAYQATKLTAFLFAIAIVVSLLRSRDASLRKVAVFAGSALVGALPQLVVLASQPERFFARARVLSVQADNPLIYVLAVIQNYWLNLAPRYLFVPRDYSDLTVARLLPPEIIFFYVGIVGLALLPAAPRSRGKWYVYIAAIISILPAALTTGNPNTLRASGIAVLTPLVSAAGIVWLSRLAGTHGLLRRIYYPAVTAVLIASAALITYRYSRSVLFREANFQNFLIHLDTALGRHERPFDAVIVENYGSQRYLYVASFTGMTPREFQRAPKQLYSDGMDHFTRLGKYHFVPSSGMQHVADGLASGRAKLLFVSTAPLNGLRVLDSVVWQREKSYLMTR